MPSILTMISDKDRLDFSQNYSVKRNYVGDILFPDIKTDDLEAENLRVPEIEGLSDMIELSYTRVSFSDPLVGMVIADMLPDVHAENLEIINVQAYIDDEEVIPYGDITFSLHVDSEEQVILYRLDQEGELVSQSLEVTDGIVSYQTSGCGRWMVIHTVLDPEEEELETTTE